MEPRESDCYAHGFDGDRQNEYNTCPECGGRVATNSHETVCEECGLVFSEEELDRGPEWRSFEEDARKRTGVPRTASLHDGGLSTEIGIGRDGNGNPLSTRRQRQFGRLRRYHGQAKFDSKRDRNRAHAFTEIRRLVSAHELGTSVRDQACSLFRQAQDADLLHGRSLEAMASASVYAVCRCNGRPLTVADIAPTSRVPEKRIRNAYSVLNVELGLPTPPRVPREFVPRLASACDVGPSVRKRALDLARLAQKCGFSTGRKPAGVAAACLIIAAREHGEEVTQVDLADAADVTPVTIRTNRDELLAVIDAEGLERHQN